jgi:TPR repeat protein
LKKAVFWYFFFNENFHIINNILRYQKSADQENHIAQLSLGICYKTGQGVKEDIDKAIFWFTKSSHQGNLLAQKQLEEIIFIHLE